MVSDEFQGGKSQTTVHNQAAYLKAQQIAQQNAAVQQQRQQAPSGLSADSPQYQQVKATEAKAAQQAYVAGQFSQKGSTSDKYSSAREQALQSGRFDYGSYGQQVPQSFVTSKGIRIERPTIPMVQGVQTTPQGTSPVITISQRQLQRTNALRAQEGLPPLESVVNVNVLATGTPSTQPSPQIQRSENRIQISLKQLQKTNAARASQGLPPLETVMRVDIVKPTKSTTPDYRSQVAQALGQAQGALGQAQGSEVSSFLKFPFAGQKVQSQNIPATSLADLFAFVPIGAGSISKGAIEAGKEISSLFTKAFSGEAPRVGESIIKTGSADIGTNVPKYTEKFRTEKNIQSMIQQKMKTPPPEMARQAPLSTSTTEVSVNLEKSPVGNILSKYKYEGKIIELYHSTTPQAATNILEQGFKTELAGKGTEARLLESSKQLTPENKNFINLLKKENVIYTSTKPYPEPKEVTLKITPKENLTLLDVSKLQGMSILEKQKFAREAGFHGIYSAEGYGVKLFGSQGIAKIETLSTSTEVSLGTGTGREVSSSGGKISTSDLFKPTSPIRPSPTTKTISLGKEVSATPQEKESYQSYLNMVKEQLEKIKSGEIVRGQKGVGSNYLKKVETLQEYVARTRQTRSDLLKSGRSLKDVESIMKGEKPLDVISKKEAIDRYKMFTGKSFPETKPKEVSAGKGLEQIVKQKEEEKQVTKTIQKQKPEFEQRQAQKQEKYLRDQEQKAEQIQKQEQIQKEAGTKTEQIQKQEQSLIQKTGLKYIRTTTQKEQKQTPFPLIQIPKPKQTQRTTPVFVIPKTEPKPQPFPLIQIPKPKQTQKYVPGGIFIPTFATPPPPTRTPPPPPPPIIPPPPPIRPTETPPPTKRIPDLGGVLGTGGLPGMLGKVSKYGQRKEFIGNVPIADIVGVYGSRSEISYGGGGARQTSKELSKAATGKFIQSTRKKVF